MATPESEMPPDIPVFSSMHEMCTTVHELYLSYIDVGFTREQAFELIKLHTHAMAHAAAIVINTEQE